MHRDRYAVCPKCEKFRLLDTNAGPEVYCSHVLPFTPWWNTEHRVASDTVPTEKIQCKVVILQEEF